jgi:hypothetical protein
MTLACFLSFSNSNPQTHTERVFKYEDEYEFEDEHEEEFEKIFEGSPQLSQPSLEKPPFRLLTRQVQRPLIGSSSFRGSP